MKGYIIKYLDDTYKRKQFECIAGDQVYLDKVDAMIACREFNTHDPYYHWVEEINIV